MKIGKSEAVLEAMGGEQGGDAIDVAEAKDEADDGLRGDRVETGGRRIVEDDWGGGDEGAGDGGRGGQAPPTVGKEGVKWRGGVRQNRGLFFARLFLILRASS